MPSVCIPGLGSVPSPAGRGQVELAGQEGTAGVGSAGGHRAGQECASPSTRAMPSFCHGANAGEASPAEGVHPQTQGWALGRAQGARAAGAVPKARLEQL